MKTHMMRCLLVIPFLFIANAAGVAQEEARTQDTASTRDSSVANDSASRDALISRWQKKNEELNRKLLEPIDIEFFKTPLDEVGGFLMDRCGIEIIIEKAALETLGLDASLPITLKLSDVALRAALDAMLDEHKLTYYTRDGILFITSQEEAASKLVTRVYNVHSLLSRDHPYESLDVLIDLLTNAVEPDSWAEVGGHGTIDTYQMTMVVSQTEQIHELIENLLRELDQIVASAGGPTLPTAVNRECECQRTKGIGLGGAGGGFGGGGIFAL